jgi:hypothetical protein
MFGLYANYGYQGRAGCGLGGLGGSGSSSLTGAHRVTGLTAPGVNFPMLQDANGNHIFASSGAAASDKTYRYTVQNQASAVFTGPESAPTRRARFWYGPDG